LATYVASTEPVEVTRNGQVVGVFVPMSPGRSFDADAFTAATAQVRDALADAAADPNEIVREFDTRRRARQ